MHSVTVEALAKVNLGLRVLYRRPDNFHELRTVFQTISLADRLTVRYQREARRSVELTCNQPDLAGPSNLAAQAAAALLEAAGARGRVTIHLEKVIPVGAGLGGGSSDAAAVLRALGSMHRPQPDRAVLWRVAAGLGSDVPFFLTGGRAVGVGRGEEVYPLEDSRREWLVVAAPPVPISTAQAYRDLSVHLTSSRWEDKIDRFCSSIWALERGPVFEAALENDFEVVVFRAHPELEKLKARLEGLGACPALLCGSGSALFGVFADRRRALSARESLDLDDGRCWVVATVNRRDYRARWERGLGRGKRW